MILSPSNPAEQRKDDTTSQINPGVLPLLAPSLRPAEELGGIQQGAPRAAASRRGFSWSSLFLMGNCAGVEGNAEINPSFSAPNSSGTEISFLGHSE